jgi:hypothetical protein
MSISRDARMHRRGCNKKKSNPKRKLSKVMSRMVIRMHKVKPITFTFIRRREIILILQCTLLTLLIARAKILIIIIIRFLKRNSMNK